MYRIFLWCSSYNYFYIIFYTIYRRNTQFLCKQSLELSPFCFLVRLSIANNNDVKKSKGNWNLFSYSLVGKNSCLENFIEIDCVDLSPLWTNEWPNELCFSSNESFVQMKHLYLNETHHKKNIRTFLVVIIVLHYNNLKHSIRLLNNIIKMITMIYVIIIESWVKIKKNIVFYKLLYKRKECPDSDFGDNRPNSHKLAKLRYVLLNYNLPIFGAT